MLINSFAAVVYRLLAIALVTAAASPLSVVPTNGKPPVSVLCELCKGTTGHSESICKGMGFC